MAQTKTAPSQTRRKAAAKPSGRSSRPSAPRRGAQPATTARSSPSKSPERRAGSKPSALESSRSSVTVKMPLLTVQVRAPHVPRMRPRAVGHAVSTAQSSLPPAERMAYYAGLGALAAFGVIEWPVAAAIGAGTILAKRTLRKDPRTSSAGGAGRATARSA